MRRSTPAFLVAFVLVAALMGLLALPACGGNTTLSMHGRVIKTVGRSCNLLSAAFPGVDGRVVSFIDETGVEIGRAVTGEQRTTDDGLGGCELSAAYRVVLPARNTYAANVSSSVTDIPTSPTIDYDTLAGAGWVFDIRIPATA